MSLRNQLFIFVVRLLMKKLVIILFVGIYSVAVFGAGILPYDCCEKSAQVVAAVPGAENSIGNHCDNTHSSDVFQNHHVAAPVHHFISRKFYSSQYGWLPAFAIAANDQCRYLVNIDIRTTPLSPAIPVYILHCVYRI